jgi:hypothetical protein
MGSRGGGDLVRLWTNPDPPEEPPPKVHLVVTGEGPRMSVAFQEGGKELATLRGPNVARALRWMLAAITDPFHTITRRDHVGR